MKIKSLLIAALMGLGCMNASAQEPTEYVFDPYWNIQVQGGGQYTLGEVDFSDLLTPHAQISVGYQFNKVFGARLSVNGWQSRAGMQRKFTITTKKYGEDDKFEQIDINRNWKWTYVAPNIDLIINLSNAIWGYNPERTFEFGVLLGAGANIAWGNEDAIASKDYINSFYERYKKPDAENEMKSERGENLQYAWEGTKVRPSARLGLFGDFNLSPNWSLGLEFNTFIVSDRYNSKKAGDKSVDWCFNGLVGLKYNIGRVSTPRALAATTEAAATATAAVSAKSVPQVVEKIVEKPVEKIIVKEAPYRIDVFFTIRGSQISQLEQMKVKELAAYLNAHPKANVTVTGYADRGTGNPTINMKYSKLRAEVVTKMLIEKYGIAANRITTEAKGDTEQPYTIAEANRVTICIAE